MMFYSTDLDSQKNSGDSRQDSGILSGEDLGADPGAPTLRQSSPFTSQQITTKSKKLVQDCTVVSMKLLKVKAESPHL